ncbi:UDP-N,N'-diacetylbacillosamine 2-epimerase (hydrolyzing) [Defluviimonas aquaemixtae]|uniref:UDP-N,N'-diacetylbacillosamine 2-epimerase (Hydrolyzing) n=1 Tax=Albidovulum aquaemixtae TaxID=1542388 RepID=A0A2R8B2X0_9RHOB|nr:UDP-N-acetylglucosamine 2-epimerase [Defluviimonas aquaemixtae]SPH16890.1 UDP-N,N'-diacetylbacillosamine 2-epimerase (hydrolyzing) [Defluviimonas aquaemixtae]
MTKRIVFLTGIRSEYDILAPVIGAVQNRDGLEAGIIVTGAHLTARHGHSVRQIEADGYPIVAQIESLLTSDSLSGRVKGAALQLIGMSDLFARARPDFLVVMGDREESITGAMAALYHHIPVVHIGGGDHAEDGNVDNPVRHAVSKLAHLHMATTRLSGQRLRALGEEDWRIHVVGASGLDRLTSTPNLAREQLDAALMSGWDGADYAVLLYHPTITDFSAARAHMASICGVLEESGLRIAAMAPNTDPGSDAVAAELHAFAARCDRVRLFSFLEREVFVNLLRHARVMVGNSSSGIVEAPTLGLPVVNIGLRQRGREHASNVIFTDYGTEDIGNALRRAAFDEAFRAEVARCETPYGDGRTSDRIADILARTEIDARLMHKRFVMERQ